MSNRDDYKNDRTGGSTPDAPYTVGNKRPPRERQFKPGRSGNPSGRPRGRPRFGITLMQEFLKTVSATKNGKTIKVTNDRAAAARLVNSAITAGPRAMRAMALLLDQVEREEARQGAEAAAAEARKAAEVDEPPKFSWSDEQEELYRELGRAIERLEKQEEKPPEDE